MDLSELPLKHLYLSVDVVQLGLQHSFALDLLLVPTDATHTSIVTFKLQKL